MSKYFHHILCNILLVIIFKVLIRWVEAYLEQSFGKFFSLFTIGEKVWEILHLGNDVTLNIRHSE